MICVYRGSNATDAYLVRDWLERNGMRAWVKGQGILGPLAQLTLREGWPSVWVDPRDRTQAEEAVRVYRGPALVHPPWRCPGCGEENGPAFGSCWHCGAEP